MLPECIRTFVAVELPEKLREALVEKCEPVKRALSRGIKWTRPENIHLTLKFLGNIHRDDIVTALDLIKKAVKGLSGSRAFSVSVPAEVRGPEPFPQGSKARLVVAPVDPVRGLVEVYKSIDKALTRVGVKREGRQFLPHITLARAKKAARGWQAGFDWMSTAGKIGILPVTSVTFFMSELGPGGPTYIPLGRQEIG